MEKHDLNKFLADIKKEIGGDISLVSKEFNIGRNCPVKAIIIFLNAQADKNIIDADILKPLMLWVDEDISKKADIDDYLTKSYIAFGNAVLETDLNKVIDAIRRGKTILYTENSNHYVILDTTGGSYRGIMEPLNESALRGPRDGFVENLETNVSIIRRRVRDKNLRVEFMTLGRRTQTDLAFIYISDIADDAVVNNIREHIKKVDVDKVTATGVLQQYIERYTFSVFPQMISTERPDRASAYLMDGKVILILDGTPMVLSAPCILIEFFQSVEDYYERSIVSNFVRFIRLIAVFLVISFSAMYLTLIKYNSELIPIKFITPIIQSRSGIALSPFMEIILMEFIIEFLREGGLRLPSKIGQTLSVVGGIIIGDTAIKSKIVSPTTLLIIGVTVIATFLIPNYDMSLALRFLRFPMILLANFLGIFGVGLGWFFILTHLCSLDSFGVPYLCFTLSDMKDTFIRAPLHKMKKRPEVLNTKDKIKQSDFRKEIKDLEKNNE